MNARHPGRFLLVSLGIASALLLLVAGLLADAGRARATTRPHLGYGFNVAGWDVSLIQAIGFDWIKVFDPPSSRLPLHVLIRLDAQAGDLDDVQAFGDGLAEVAASHGTFIEAYEIGNEVNLGAAYGWGAAPVAADYVTLLCEAYRQIKANDPESVVVSAGLAPTGRISGTWEGHAGHDGTNQDEREWLKEFLAAGGAGCADAVGYHPYGFSADYDAPPDVYSPEPDRNCVNGFCFRGVEKIRELLVEGGAEEKAIWATEFGWIVTPPEHCLDDPSFAGRLWQLVSEEKQAANLVGAYEYANTHWPWMGAMFVFNLNFNAAGWYAECDQIRYYAVQGRPAEDALRDGLVKEPVPAVLSVSPRQISVMVPVGAQPVSVTRTLLVRNEGWAPLLYTVTVSGEGLVSTAGPDQGSLLPLAEFSLPVIIASRERPAGVYTATVEVAAGAGALDAPVSVTVSLFLVEAYHTAHLPFLRR